MKREDHDIPIGDIKPECKEDIIEKQRAVEAIYRKSFAALYVKARQLFRGREHDQKDAIQGFFVKKIFPKKIGRLKEIEQGKLSYVVKMFENHAIDIFRKQERDRKKAEAYIEEKKASQSRDINLEWIPIGERPGFVVSKYKKAVAANFRNGQYPEIFELAIQGYTNPEIAEELGIHPSTVGTARHRIRKFIESKRKQQ